jgi:hypothetical protein
VRALSDDGLLVGSMVFYALEEHPMAWKGGQFVAAGPVSYGVGYAVDVNKTGQIVGVSAGGPPCWGGMYLWETGTTSCLGHADPSQRTRPERINDASWVVGSAYREAGAYQYGFLLHDGRLIDLNGVVPESDWEIIAATGLNEKGEIVANGRHHTTGATGALLLRAP